MQLHAWLYPLQYTCRHAHFSNNDVHGGRWVWVRALEKALKFYGLSSQATPTQLSSYLMNKIEIFQQNATEEQATPLKAPCVVGLQPVTEDPEASSDSQQQASTRVWVLNDAVHLDDDGHHISSSPYIWLGNHCSGKHHKHLQSQSKLLSQMTLVRGCYLA